MSNKKILVVDDAPTVVCVLKALLEGEGYTVHAAANGVQAIEAVKKTDFDLIVLDLQMPDMNGFQVIVEVRKTHPNLPIIVFSAHASDGAEETLLALDRGATDWVSKPSSDESAGTPLTQLRSGLLPKIKALAGRRIPDRIRPAEPAPTSLAERKQAAQKSLGAKAPSAGGIGVVAIGISTGGPPVLAQVLRDLPADFPAPILIVQHMPAEFTRTLAQRLDRDSPLHVVEAFQGMHLLPGVVYLAPGGVHMRVEKQSSSITRIELAGTDKVNGCCPAADPLFQSVAKAYGKSALGMVLTGMGSDGTVGANEMQRLGSRIMVQDEESSIVWGMPGSVIKAGIQAEILPLTQIASRLTEACMGNAARRSA